eukprot:TRINITY_DN2604_c1_g1_i1.p1 TRINITY_DN2604_c1_g1~~TRINITY_DN2604_c1_g1_i1.p1  ORF type:complete len:315 (+),score=47.03 TRINITY_DN2604_c1_g1_i1:76-1020(+)
MQLTPFRSLVGAFAATVVFSELSSVVLGVTVSSRLVAIAPAKVNVSSATGSAVNRTHAADGIAKVVGGSSVAGVVVNQTHEAVVKQNLSVIFPSSSNQQHAVVGHLSQKQVKGSMHFMSPHVVSSDKCSCEFHDLCSCEGIIQFMQCITDRCNSGTCACEETQFQHACISIAGTCSVEMLCTAEKATCLVEEEAHLWRQNRTKTTIYEELVELKENKCRLEMAAEDGWLNADRQLKTVSLNIETRMRELRELMAPLPEMHCEKHFKEWHEEYLMKGDRRSGSCREASPSLMFQACVAIAAVFGTVAAADGAGRR